MNVCWYVVMLTKPRLMMDGSPDVRLRSLSDKLIEGKYFFDNADWFQPSVNITHWMKLPKLPLK